MVVRVSSISSIGSIRSISSVSSICSISSISGISIVIITVPLHSFLAPELLPTCRASFCGRASPPTSRLLAVEQ